MGNHCLLVLDFYQLNLCDYNNKFCAGVECGEVECSDNTCSTHSDQLKQDILLNVARNRHIYKNRNLVFLQVNQLTFITYYYDDKKLDGIINLH